MFSGLSNPVFCVLYHPTLTLHVADTNVRARQLYERHGFHVARVERSHFTRPIWGFRSMVYMTKQLTGSAS
jgi:ribosomal protein S18 acetylase RimI-like enzyme